MMTTATELETENDELKYRVSEDYPNRIKCAIGVISTLQSRVKELETDRDGTAEENRVLSERVQRLVDWHVRAETAEGEIKKLRKIIAKHHTSIGLPYSEEEVEIIRKITNDTIDEYEKSGEKFYGNRPFENRERTK